MNETYFRSVEERLKMIWSLQPPLLTPNQSQMPSHGYLCLWFSHYSTHSIFSTFLCIWSGCNRSYVPQVLYIRGPMVPDHGTWDLLKMKKGPYVSRSPKKLICSLVFNTHWGTRSAGSMFPAFTVTWNIQPFLLNGSEFTCFSQTMSYEIQYKPENMGPFVSQTQNKAGNMESRDHIGMTLVRCVVTKGNPALSSGRHWATTRYS